jgi:hypothetical protein
MPAQPTLQQLKEAQPLIQRIISNLTDYGNQVGEIDDLKAEREKAQAQLDATKQQLKGWQQEVKEAEHYRDKYLAEAREKLAESERLDKQIADKRVVVSQLDAYVNKIRQQLG